MYEFPYGAGQQLNLNWIINEIITLHKQLDPDYELPNFDNAFPYMNLNQLNLDWILRELKAIKDLAPTEDGQLLKMVANALIANTYDAETQYNVDDIVYRNSDNRLYKCITATPAGGEPFDSTKWVEVDVGGVLTDLLNSVVIPPEPYDNNPAMNGTASAGTSTQYARGDHVHPKDTARVPTSRTVNGKALSSNITLNASDIPNDSNVTGDNTDDALNILNSATNSVESSIAIVSNNNTHIAITKGEYVYVKNHGTLSEGLYIAKSNISANDTLTNSNLTALPKGGFNLLSLPIQKEFLSAELPATTETSMGTVSLSAGKWIIFTFTGVSTSVDAVIYNKISYSSVSRSFRGNGKNGGGHTGELIVDLSATTTVTFYGYSPQATTMVTSVDIMKIG